MGFLEQVKTGIIPQKEFILPFGQSGVGKTSFAASFPKPIFADIEGGSQYLNVARLPKAHSFKELMAQVNELLNTKHDYESFCFDSLDHFEPMVNAAACEENGWKTIDEGAFGKGYAAALAKWTEFMGALKKLREKMNIILIAHSMVKTINDPMKMQPYDRHEIKLQAKAAALVKESVDAILFCAFEVHLKENKSGKAKALENDGIRVMYTQSRPSHEAKNRYALPYKLPLSYEAYQEARTKNQPDNPQALKSRIEENLADLRDEAVKEKAKKTFEEAGNDAVKLSKILNRLEVLNASA